MKKTFTRILEDGEEIKIDSHLDFIDNEGTRHPRNILWLWSDDDLWDKLSIRVDWVIEPVQIDVIDPIMIPKEPDAPLPVAPPPQALPPAPPAPPAPPPAEIRGTRAILSKLVERIKEAGIEPTPEVIAAAEKAVHKDALVSTLVAYGGIAFRTLRLEKKNHYHQGHRHNYDHVTNLVKGSVLCEVDDSKPRVFIAPSQICIDADKWHKFTALEDDVIYQCVYRQPERTDIYTADNSPYGEAPYTDDEIKGKILSMVNPCAHCNCDDEPDV